MSLKGQANSVQDMLDCTNDFRAGYMMKVAVMINTRKQMKIAERVRVETFVERLAPARIKQRAPFDCGHLRLGCCVGQNAQPASE